MVTLSKETRERAIGMLQVGQTQRQFARHFGCSVKTIYYLWQRFNQIETTSDRLRSGRPGVTALREDRRIRLLHLRNRFVPATVTARNLKGRHISAQTMRNRLWSTSLRSRRPYTGPVLTRRHRTNHLNWARAHRRWIREWIMCSFQMDIGSVWPMAMGDSECGDVVAKASQKVAYPSVTALAEGASWSGVVFAAVIAPGW